MQCLIHTPKFINRFCNEFKNNGELTKEFYDFLKAFVMKGDKSSISPSYVKSEIGKKHKKFAGYSQQDSQEFVRVFIDEISKEMNRIRKENIPRYKELDTKDRTKSQQNEEFHKLFIQRENSIIIDTFYGQTCNTFKCECDYESYAWEKFLDLPLLISKSFWLNTGDSDDVGLTRLLRDHFAKDTVIWEVKCDNCKKKCEHSVQLKISKLPEILIISLQRYNYRSKRKASNLINFKERIDLKEFTDTKLGEILF